MAGPGILLLGGYCALSQLFVPDRPELNQPVALDALVVSSLSAAINHDGMLFVIGGRDVASGLSMSKVQVITASLSEDARRPTDVQLINTTLDISPDIVSEVASVNEARYAHTAVVLRGSIVVCGGWSDQVVNDGRSPILYTCERYDSLTGQWSFIGSMPAGRYSHAAAALHNFMYIIGGWNGDPALGGYYREMLVYNVHSDRWSYGPPMLSVGRRSRSTLAALPVHGHVLACGSQRNYTESSAESFGGCEVYSPYTGGWRELMPVSGERIRPQLVEHDERVYLLGAFGIGDAVDSAVEEIDILANSSVLLVDQPLARRCAAFAAVSVGHSRPPPAQARWHNFNKVYKLFK